MIYGLYYEHKLIIGGDNAATAKNAICSGTSHC